jgi:hypothetical protein
MTNCRSMAVRRDQNSHEGGGSPTTFRRHAVWMWVGV